MPEIKAMIGGRSYSFAPLKLKEVRELQSKKQQNPSDAFESIDLWKPFIVKSMAYARNWSEIDGVNTMPDFEDMDIETGSLVFRELIVAVMKACGVEAAKSGEAGPVLVINGTSSTAASSQLPDGQ